jgi:hypothetical protein
MQTIEVKTGFGYYRDAQGHIISKAELPEGTHPLKNGFTYVEVADKAALDAIVIYVDPAEIIRQENDGKITAKSRAIAIAQCIKDGDLPPDYTES